MISQTSLRIHPLPAMVANVPLTAILMDPHVVVLQIFLLQKSLITQLTLVFRVRFVTFFVSGTMALQSCFVVARSVANIAYMYALTVLRSHVVLILLLRDEPCSAVLASCNVFLQVALYVGAE